MDRTWLMGMARVTLSLPVMRTSLGEVETIVPETVVPSRISSVAAGPGGALAHPLHNHAHATSAHAYRSFIFSTVPPLRFAAQMLRQERQALFSPKAVR